MMSVKRIYLLILLCLALSACSSGVVQTSVVIPVDTTPQPVQMDTPSATPTSTATITARPPTETPTLPPTSTFTPTPTQTFTPTPVPTYVRLRGKVIIDQAVCHYGPGAPYLYKYGVYKGSNLEILRRVALGNYIEVQAIGGNNPCWVRADYMEIDGDLMDLEPVNAEDVKLPFTPYYSNTITGVSAQRSGNEVTISWHPFVLRPGDDSEQVPYLIESWVCQNGQYIFNPVGAWQTSITIVDEPGCDQPSHARIYATEKHGYTRWVNIPWPAADEITPEAEEATPAP